MFIGKTRDVFGRSFIKMQYGTKREREAKETAGVSARICVLAIILFDDLSCFWMHGFGGSASCFCATKT